MAHLTRVLSAIEHGDAQAAKELLPLVYDELRKLAAHKVAQEKPGHTLNATALVALDEALQRLTAEEPTAAEVVKLRYFAGLTAAAALGISLRTANRHWGHAKAWLYRHMMERDGSGA